MINLWIAMFENSTKIYQIVLFNGFLSYFVEMCVYVLKQLLFSISVNSGFGNIYLAAFAAR